MDLRIAQSKGGSALIIRAHSSSKEELDSTALSKDIASTADVHVILQKPNGIEDEDDPKDDKEENQSQISWRDVLLLPHIFWVLVISCVVVYSCVLPFNNISSSLLLERDYFQAPPGQVNFSYSIALNITVVCFSWLPLVRCGTVREQLKPASKLSVLVFLPAAPAKKRNY